MTFSEYAHDLHTLLHAAGLPPPYILVGGSIGGPIVWQFGAHYPSEVGGIVMVDAAHPNQWERMRALLPPPSPDEPAALSAFRSSEIEANLDPQRNDEGMDLGNSVSQFEGVRLGDIPLIVLTAGQDEWEPGFPPDLAATLEQDWMEMQKEIAALSTNSTHMIVAGSGHCIHDDKPGVLIDVILQLVERAHIPDMKPDTHAAIPDDLIQRIDSRRKAGGEPSL
jgi:pimeloyl-ACP methyl ester carboxylesterase